MNFHRKPSSALKSAGNFHQGLTRDWLIRDLYKVPLGTSAAMQAPYPTDVCSVLDDRD